MGRNKDSRLKKGTLQLVLLLALFSLIKLGQIPLLIIKNTSNVSLPSQKTLNKRIQWIKPFIFISIFLALFFGYTLFTFQVAQELPSPDKLQSPTQPLTTEFYDRNGTLLYRLYEGRNRSLVKIEELPKELIFATVASEDKNFYKHPGFDLVAILRAVSENLKGEELQGASTITQQVVKNSLLTPEKTLSRKLKEIFLAFWAERIYSKDQILQIYFNEAPFGGTAWGVEVAASTYFGKSAKDLTLAESSFIAGLPASPTEYSPYGQTPEKGKQRQKFVLDRMVEEGYISKNTSDEAFNLPLPIREVQNQLKAPHFVMYTRDFLAKKYGERIVSGGGLKVTTTLDLGLQTQIELIVKEEIEKLLLLNVNNGAAMVTDSKTGQILSMVGSKDYHEPNYGKFNVTLSLRQPGSSIKPATYASAFKQGFSPGNTIIDAPVSFPDGTNKRYTPLNYDRAFHGPVSLRTALGSSYNVPAVKLLATVGKDAMIQTARDLGITTFDDPPAGGYGLSLTLGGAAVKMIDMMAMYGTFSQNGKLARPTPILKVLDSYGNVLEEIETEGTQVIQSEIAYLITHILSDNTARTPGFGPNSSLYIPGYDVAVKTGTSDSKRDNWTFGYTPDFVVGVWVGNNDNSPMHKTLTSGITGAAPIWNRIIKGLLATRDTAQFIKPSGIIEVRVDGRRDLAVSGILPKGLVRVRAEGNKTTFFDAFSAYATSSAITSIKNGAAN